MRHLLRVGLLIVLLASSPLGLLTPVRAGLDPGTLDTGFDPGAGPDDLVRAMALQMDGSIVIAGRFDNVDGTARDRIARLEADGAHDSFYFGSPTGANGTIIVLALQKDDKILIGGAFTSYDATARNRIARLTSTGALDTGFDPGTGANDAVEAIAIQPDGKVLIAGGFTSVDGTPRNYVARLNADGSLDTTFDPGVGPNASVSAIALQDDGKVLIGGDFGQVDGVASGHVARLNADGTRDSAFSGSVNARVRDIAVLDDGKIIIVGDFTGTTNHIARLKPGGQRDTTFDPGAGADDDIWAVAVQPDGKLVVGGEFSSFAGQTEGSLTRLEPDGAIDPSFYVTGTYPHTNGDVFDVLLQPDGKILIGGDFTQCHAVTRNRIARLHIDGSLDEGLQTDVGPRDGSPTAIHDVVARSDGTLYVAGNFAKFRGIARRNLVRLHANGHVYYRFGSDSGGPNGAVHAIALQDDGKVILGGDFVRVDGVDRAMIARVDAEGDLDATFDPGTGLDRGVSAVALQPDGKVLIGGFFTTVDGTSRNAIARLNADGSLDTTFDPGSGANQGVEALSLQADGKVVIAGRFTAVNGVARAYVARLNADGSLDTTFDPGSGPSAAVTALALQPDGAVLIGGSFATVGGVARRGIARLGSDGSLDTTFDPGKGCTGDVTALYLQEDGEILVVGSFTEYNTVSRPRLARVESDGDLDAAFDPGAGANNTVTAIAAESGGKYIIAGDFGSYDSVAKMRIARINGASGAYVGGSGPPDGKVNQPYAYTFEVGGYPRPVFFVASGTLPPGLTLDGEARLLSGTPTEAGQFQISVAAANYVATYGNYTGPITIDVADPDPTPGPTPGPTPDPDFDEFVYLPLVLR